jgi:hypothetical protein
MRIRLSQLRQIIAEETRRALNEADEADEDQMVSQIKDIWSDLGGTSLGPDQIEQVKSAIADAGGDAKKLAELIKLQTSAAKSYFMAMQQM